MTPPDSDRALPEQEDDPQLTGPTQPGMTPPRVAPLPVPGQSTEAPQSEAELEQDGEQTAPQPGAQAEGDAEDTRNAEAQQPDNSMLVQPQRSQPQQQQQQWEAPRLEDAPPAPVVEMTGPHAELGANIDGGTLLPGYVANTHHFSNEAGYVGTIGYNTPAGAGEAGISVEFVDPNTIALTTYTGGEGVADNTATTVFDTTQLNMARAAVEDWIREQPGGAAALEAAAAIQPPLPSGEFPPQTIEVGGVITQWGGSLQY
ncbi:hypothetical protein ACL02S_13945 [Nocardia sp. 004]|uniref:hypothetical protein n=1 Tax=Nocardia sp. 004 TaxID=3385978 RepID=UPI00399FAC4F